MDPVGTGPGCQTRVLQQKRRAVALHDRSDLADELLGIPFRQILKPHQQACDIAGREHGCQPGEDIGGLTQRRSDEVKPGAVIWHRDRLGFGQRVLSEPISAKQRLPWSAGIGRGRDNRRRDGAFAVRPQSRDA